MNCFINVMILIYYSKYINSHHKIFLKYQMSRILFNLIIINIKNFFTISLHYLDDLIFIFNNIIIKPYFTFKKTKSKKFIRQEF